MYIATYLTKVALASAQKVKIKIITKQLEFKNFNIRKTVTIAPTNNQILCHEELYR